MIAIVDYGMGNLRSVQKALEKVGSKAVITSSSRKILQADGVVLPGVGAFDSAMQVLRRAKLVDPLIRVIKENRPFLGICLGLQLLFSSSEEGGKCKGLAVIEGKVKKFKKKGLKIPHLGWNTIKIKKAEPLLAEIEENSYFYFVHSYCVCPEDKSWIAATTDYVGEFCSAVSRGNLFACQFHPEKSSEAGLRLLGNFVRLVEEKSA
ncbi:MAG: imidazole glycerol phosphate synthase subunit HisH [Elusimicrobiota bacterium]